MSGNCAKRSTAFPSLPTPAPRLRRDTSATTGEPEEVRSNDRCVADPDVGRRSPNASCAASTCAWLARLAQPSAKQTRSAIHASTESCWASISGSARLHTLIVAASRASTEVLASATTVLLPSRGAVAQLSAAWPRSRCNRYCTSTGAIRGALEPTPYLPPSRPAKTQRISVRKRCDSLDHSLAAIVWAPGMSTGRDQHDLGQVVA